jgi:hypothetical protein
MKLWRVEWHLPDGDTIAVNQIKAERAADAIFIGHGELGQMSANVVKSARAIMVEEQKKTDILVELRDAFEGDDVARKNIMLRRAHDEISDLRAKIRIRKKKE